MNTEAAGGRTEALVQQQRWGGPERVCSVATSSPVRSIVHISCVKGVKREQGVGLCFVRFSADFVKEGALQE
jgi:hypothetical protein